MERPGPNVPSVPIVPPSFPEDEDSAGVDADWDDVTLWDLPRPGQPGALLTPQATHDSTYC